MLNVEPKTITDTMIDIGCKFTASENRSGTNTFPSINCINAYIKDKYKNSLDIPNCTADINMTGIDTIIAPIYGIITDNPTKNASKSA